MMPPRAPRTGLPPPSFALLLLIVLVCANFGTKLNCPTRGCRELRAGQFSLSTSRAMEPISGICKGHAQKNDRRATFAPQQYVLGDDEELSAGLQHVEARDHALDPARASAASPGTEPS